MGSGGSPGTGGEVAANEPAERKLPVGPLELELELLFVPLSLVLDVELGASGHVDPLSRDLDLEPLARLEVVGQPAQLRHELGGRVDLLDVPVPLLAHLFSLVAHQLSTPHGILPDPDT